MFFNITIFIGLMLSMHKEPQLEEILQKHYKSINLEGHTKIESLEMKGKVEFYLNEQSFENEKPNLAGTFKEFIKLPNQRYYESKFDNVNGTFRQGYNHGKSWVIDGGGLKTSTPNQSIALIIEQRFDISPNLFRLEQRGFTPSYMGKRTIGKKKCHCIKLKHKNGDQHFYYLDTKSFLVRMIAFADEESEKENWTKRYFYNYKLVYNVMIPHLQYDKVFYSNNITTTMLKYSDIKANTNIDPSIYKTPQNP